MDSYIRSSAKSATYRVAGSAITAAIVFLFGGRRAGVSIGAAAIDALLKVGLYFFHERIWECLHLIRLAEKIGGFHGARALES